MIHHSARQGYAASAPVYVRGRPSYPPEASAWLREVIGLGPGRVVLELGAGTGKFVPLLVETGANVIALEPVDEMRAQIEARPVETLPGTAEDIGLPNAAVDAVICAQAFHWFANARALAEIRRVLRPGGVLGLIWNGRDTAVPWVAEWGKIVDIHQGDTPRYQSGAWRGVFPAQGFSALEERRTSNPHVGSPDRVIIDRTLSTSFISALPASARAQIEAQLRDLIDRTPELRGRGEIDVPYETLMVAFRKDPE